MEKLSKIISHKKRVKHKRAKQSKQKNEYETKKIMVNISQK